ncbi:hypothetical protein H9S92_17740, partial [Lewinella lacunae]
MKCSLRTLAAPCLKICAATLIFIFCNTQLPAEKSVSLPPPEDCNNPLAGKNAIVDEISPGLVGLLLAGSNLGNVVNEDLEDFVDINITAAVLGTAIVSVKDISETYPAGRRAGFVLQSNGGLLSASALSGLSIRTYLNDVPQETATFGGGLLDLAVLGNAGGKQRLGFTTTLPFDEIELYLSSTLTL